MDATSIPQEVIDLFIDQLSTDKKALEACSVVCRGWTYSARRHIFSRILLECVPANGYFWRNRYVYGIEEQEARGGVGAAGGLQEANDGLVPIHIPRCSALLQLFGTSALARRITPYVHTLALSMSSFDFWVHHSITPVELKGLTDLLGSLPNLRRLEFTPRMDCRGSWGTMFWSTFPQTVLDSFTAIGGTLETLSLNGWFITPDELLGMLGRCGSNLRRLELHKLHVHAVHFQGHDDVPAESTSDSLGTTEYPDLKEIVMESVYFKGPETEDWIKTVVSNAREVRIRKTTYESMQEHLDAIGDGLEVLDVDVGPECDYPPLPLRLHD